MPKALKLTEAQQVYLRLLGQGPRTGLSSYKPAEKLIALGLAIRGRAKGLQNSEYRITEAGREALRAEGGKDVEGSQVDVNASQQSVRDR